MFLQVLTLEVFKTLNGLGVFFYNNYCTRLGVAGCGQDLLGGCGALSFSQPPGPDVVPKSFQGPCEENSQQNISVKDRYFWTS